MSILNIKGLKPYFRLRGNDKKLLCNFLFLFSCFPAYSAIDCLRYKSLPSFEIKEPSFSVSVVQPNEKLDLLHGSVVSTFVEEYDITYGAEGRCVFIERVDAVIGYSTFVIRIDRRHPFDSCEWKAVKEHEDEHIRAHLSVISDNRAEIKKSIAAAADSVLPVFIENDSEIDAAMEKLEAELQNSPQIRLLMQKLSAEQEIRNKKIDLEDKGERFRQCDTRP